MLIVFDHPLVLWLVPLCAAAAWVLTWTARRRRIGRAAAWSAELATRAAEDGPRAAYILAFAGAALACALAGPRWGRTSVTTETRALDLILTGRPVAAVGAAEPRSIARRPLVGSATRSG